MNHSTTLLQILVTLFVIGCNDRTEIKVVDVKMVEVQDSTNKPPPPPSGLKVSAHLIYNDESVSSFDVLNDKSIVLWNTIIGAGDALKPSTKVKVIIFGDLDSLNIKIKNGRRTVIDKKTGLFRGGIEYIIKDAGCEQISVNVTRDKKTLYNDTIPFHCGE